MAMAEAGELCPDNEVHVASAHSAIMNWAGRISVRTVSGRVRVGWRGATRDTLPHANAVGGGTRTVTVGYAMVAHLAPPQEQHGSPVPADDGNQMLAYNYARDAERRDTDAVRYIVHPVRVVPMVGVRPDAWSTHKDNCAPEDTARLVGGHASMDGCLVPLVPPLRVMRSLPLVDGGDPGNEYFLGGLSERHRQRAGVMHPAYFCRTDGAALVSACDVVFPAHALRQIAPGMQAGECFAPLSFGGSVETTPNPSGAVDGYALNQVVSQLGAVVCAVDDVMRGRLESSPLVTTYQLP